MTQWIDGVPEVVAPSMNVDSGTGYGTINFEAPRALTLTVAPGIWFGTTIENFDPSKVNDIEIEETAFSWLTGAGTSEIIFQPDMGPQAFRGVRLAFDTSAVAVAPYTISYSADGSTWTAVASAKTTEEVDGDITKQVRQWAVPDTVTPNYWKVARTSGTLQSAITEIWFFAFEAENAEIEEVRIYDRSTGARTFANVVPRGVLEQPLNITAIINHVSLEGQSFTIDVVVYDGENESAGITFTDASPARRAQFVVAANSMAGIGGRIVVGPTAKLTTALTAVATSIDVESNVFASGDRVVLQKVVAGVQQTEYLAITSASSGSGPYTYSVTRNLDASGADSWAIDDVLVGLGQTGSHFIDLYSARGLKSSSEVGPTIVGNVRNSATWNDWTPRWAIGNLNGLFGYATDIFGAAFGVPSAAWLKIDPTNGLRIGHNATTKIQIDASGNAKFTGAIRVESGGSIAVGSPYTWGNSSTKFYVDGAGNFSLGNAFLWDGTNIQIDSATYAVGPTFGVSVNENGIGGRGYHFSTGGVGGPDFGGIFGTNAKEIVVKCGNAGNAQLTIGAAGAASSSYMLFGGSLLLDYDLEARDAKLTGLLFVDGVAVVGNQGAAVASIASPNATDLASVITLANELKARHGDLAARIRAHGLIAT